MSCRKRIFVKTWLALSLLNNTHFKSIRHMKNRKGNPLMHQDTICDTYLVTILHINLYENSLEKSNKYGRH